jgi:hypothetical protein
MIDSSKELRVIPGIVSVPQAPDISEQAKKWIDRYISHKDSQTQKAIRVGSYFFFELTLNKKRGL